MTNRNSPEKQYGQGDATFIAAGGEEGIRLMVDVFYANMKNSPKYQRIWNWHPADNETTRDMLTLFLFGWMGGPRVFAEKYGMISIPQVHMHLRIKVEERDMWLNCMHEALESLEYPQDFIEYLMAQFFIPAERIRQTCS